MNYERRYNEILAAIKKLQESNSSDEGIQNWINDNVPELCESEDERIRKKLISFVENWTIFNPNSPFDDYPIYTSDKSTVDKILAWLEKQGNDSYLQEKINAFTNAHKGEDPEDIIAACRGYEKQDDQKPTWSEEDTIALSDALWAIEQARTIAKDENDMGNLWYAERWLKSIKDRVQPPTWKPSEEQMWALERCVDYLEESDNEDAEKIESLLNDLKKLNE